MEEVVDPGNGGEASLDAPSKCEQSVNKGVDKKAERLSLSAFFSTVWRLIINPI
jgi:hypothetical protein